MDQAGVVSFNFTIIMQLINTLIICGVLAKILVKPVHEFIQKRQDMVNNYLRNADIKNEEALDLKRQYEQKIRMAQKESHQILSAAKTKADDHSKEIINEAERQAEELKRLAEAAIEMEKSRSLNEARGEIVSMAVFMAEKILEKTLDEKEQHEFIDRILEEAGKKDV